MHGPIGIAQTPELFRVAQVAGGDVIQPLFVGDSVFLQQRKSFWGRHKTAAQVDDGFASFSFQGGGFQAVITAGGWEEIGFQTVGGKIRDRRSLMGSPSGPRCSTNRPGCGRPVLPIVGGGS